MAVTKIRLARGGSKKRPYYYVVVAPATAPRDGRYIERIGSYNPMLPKDHENRIRLDEERCKYWLGVGAQPTDRVARFLEKAGLKDAHKRNNPQKGLPGKKRQEREAEEAERKRQAEEEAAAAAAEAAEAAEGGAEATAE